MTRRSVFDQKHIADATAHRRDILEELNLPPQVIAFLRANSKAILWMAVALVLLILGVSAFNHYRERQLHAAADLLAQAMQKSTFEEREPLLKQVIAEYPRTSAAQWSSLELAHGAFNAGVYETAVAGYQEVIDDLSADSSLLPLARYSLGQAYESKGDLEAALSAYQELSRDPSFKTRSLLAQARVYELQAQPAKALEMLQQIDLEGAAPSLDANYLAARINRLQQKTTSSEKTPEQPATE